MPKNTTNWKQESITSTAMAAAARRGDTRILNLLLCHETSSNSLTEKDLCSALDTAIRKSKLDSTTFLAKAYQSTFDIGPNSKEVIRL